MGLREKIMQSVQKIFGRKVLTSVSEVEEVEKEGGQLTQTAVSEFEKNIKVENTPTLDGKLFSQITSEARNSVLMNLQAFRNTVLSSDEFKKLQGKDARPGMADKVPFVCVAEMDDDGKIKTTIIATNQAVSKIAIDENGNRTYQESRIVDGEMKTIINDDKNGTLHIGGNVSQKDIDNIKKFAYQNKSQINEISKIKGLSDEEKAKYFTALEKFGVKTDIDLNDTKKYLFGASGRIIRGKPTVLKEADFVFDKENPDSNPLIISLNTLKDKKTTREKYRLYKDNIYIDESSLKFNKDGNVKFKTITLEELQAKAMEDGFNMLYMDRVKSHKANKKEMIPQGAVDIHNGLVEEKTKEAEKKNQKDEQEQSQAL
ncbi:MAG: hypothetical protein IKL55_04945 [Clostridia bacterium]|nr:hypothetical protein [Clostridia bacterium]